MTPERWQQVKQIFDSAIRLAEPDREAFLSSACSDNQSLRKEVASLIEAHEKDGSFIDRPAFEKSKLFQLSELKPGQAVGSYVITGKPKQLTFDKETMGFACWSRDSKVIAFETKRGDNNFLSIISSLGGDPIQLNSGRGQSWPFSFSKDGDKIAFAGFRDGYWNVWWYSFGTQAETQVTQYKKLNAFVRYTSWSPSGNQIAYEYAETTGNIWMTELK